MEKIKEINKRGGWKCAWRVEFFFKINKRDSTFIREMRVLCRNVHVPKCSHAEMFLCREVLVPKSPCAEKSPCRNVPVLKCPSAGTSAAPNGARAEMFP